MEFLLGLVTFLKGVKDSQGRHNADVAEAFVSLFHAITSTRNHISSNSYEPSLEISKLWLDAYAKGVKAGFTDEKLFHKAEFWVDPQTWLSEEISMELVPMLDDLESECRSIQVGIR